MITSFCWPSRNVLQTAAFFVLLNPYLTSPLTLCITPISAESKNLPLEKKIQNRLLWKRYCKVKPKYFKYYCGFISQYLCIQIQALYFISLSLCSLFSVSAKVWSWWRSGRNQISSILNHNVTILKSVYSTHWHTMNLGLADWSRNKTILILPNLNRASVVYGCFKVH